MQYWDCNGVRLAGEVRGDGDPPLLFVHGWCCDRSFLAPQVAHFAGTHRVVSVDLRGHGASGGAGGPVGVAELAADLAGVLEQLEVSPAVVVGHSMGGTVGLELAVSRPDLVRGLAMLDTLVAVPEELAGAAAGLSLLLASPRYGEAIAGFVDQYLLRADSAPALRRRVLDTMMAADPEVAHGCWESMRAYDDRGALKACTVPLLLIAVESTIAGLAELPDLNPALGIARLRGVSHFHPIEAPALTNREIERFIAGRVPTSRA